MFNPISTYRIQFNKDFTFKQFDKIIPYLQNLGIRTVYASPIFEAVPGSNHGYDTTNPNKINPEIGTLTELKNISKKLKEAQINWIQDIVPNHMAFHQNNQWLMDVLRNGERSPYRNFFDIISSNLENEPLMVPFLGEDVENIIDRGEIVKEQDNGLDFIKYFDSRWPVREDTDTSRPIREILDHQYYRLCSYKESNERINYRRFFTVNSLICLNVQNDDTFLAFHKLIKKLIDEKIIQGIRIDHIDGLADPKGYIDNLRKNFREDVYIVAEKILEPGEDLPTDWKIQGTTGYDFLGLTNQLLTNHAALPKFERLYKEFAETASPVDVQIRNKKKDFLFSFMKGELNNLTDLFTSVASEVAEHRDIYKELIAEFLVRCPVYRYYGSEFPLSEQVNDKIAKIILSIETDYPLRAEQLMHLKAVLLGRDLTFYKRLMQFTGPLMAKGVEDTLMYTFNRFIGSNEVGDSPEVFGISVADFHEEMKIRQRNWPLTLNTSSTHDTKRGEDARARLEVLTNMKTAWFDRITAWRHINDHLKVNGSPDTNDEYFIYQTLIATYPDTEAEKASYVTRINEYLEKALRESKRNSSWDEPNVEYEQQVKIFTTALLDAGNPFFKDFLSFLSEISAYGRITSLAALMLKYGCPGIADLYQGTELWDFSFVDPDNRRTVDYSLRMHYLTNTLESKSFTNLWEGSATGKIKLLLIKKLLGVRNVFHKVFSDGHYVPIELTGRYAEAVFAFARRYQNDWLIFVIPLNLPLVTAYRADQIGKEDWADTSIIMPAAASGACTDLLRETGQSLGHKMLLNDICKDLPLGLLHVRQPERQRGSGILMHISSLPSSFGTGDIGPTALAFLDFLSKARQKYWQLLPLNPVSPEQSYSPYSSTSIMAGNTLFISPEILAEEGLLDAGILEDYKQKNTKTLDYNKAAKLKNSLLQMAYRKYLSNPDILEDLFKNYRVKESNWLEDYSLYVVIKEQNANDPWYKWPVQLRDRDEEALNSFRTKYNDHIMEVMWQQFIFDRQWKRLRKYAEVLDIKLIGDLPFYTSADAADVWAHRRLFKIDSKGNISGLAGVPPDYFNEEGQLWGMPVYNWDAMADEDYDWWLSRIGRNLELYDYVRLDHFRAFSEYWEVPSTATTAKDGRWQKGPGAHLFQKLEEVFGKLPLIAEDLGEITEDVYTLRDQFKLPGMKVLQFGFGSDHAVSIHAPHMYQHVNCLTYTGTHDNNTVLGWYKNEADKSTRKLISEYVGYKATRHNINQTMIRLAYASIANIAIVPMQDVLSEGSESRMNTPSSTEKNWLWKMKSYRRVQKCTASLAKLTEIYGR